MVLKHGEGEGEGDGRDSRRVMNRGATKGRPRVTWCRVNLGRGEEGGLLSELSRKFPFFM